MNTMELALLISWDNSIQTGQRSPGYNFEVSFLWGGSPKHSWSTFNTRVSFSAPSCEVLLKGFEETEPLAQHTFIHRSRESETFPTRDTKTLFPVSNKSSSNVSYLPSASSLLPPLGSVLYFFRRNLSHSRTPVKGHRVRRQASSWSMKTCSFWFSSSFSRRRCMIYDFPITSFTEHPNDSCAINTDIS